MTTTTMLRELTGDYAVDAARSRLGFTARHTVGPRVPGEFEVFSGVLRLDGEDPGRSTADLTIQADSIQTGDRRRDAALREHFLDAETYPSIKFRSTKVSRTGVTTFTVTGNLTIRGATRPVVVPLELTGTDDGVAFTGSLPLLRKRWSVNWNAATNLMVAQKLDLHLDLTANRIS